jgi:hypothetical protein
MNSKQRVLAIAVAAVLSLSLSSCSGVGDTCKVNCGGGGGGGGSNASLNVMLAAQPFTPPPGTSLLSFAVVVNSISLTPSSGGSDVTIPLNNSTYAVDMIKLQSDSAYLGQSVASVPTGTYNGLSVNASAVATYCAATTGTPGCNPGSVAQFSKSFTTPTVPNFSLTLGSNQQAGLRIVINFNNAMTVNAATQAVTGLNLTAANVLSTISLPPSSSTLSSGQQDYLDDVTGVVTAASSSSVTIQTATRGPVTSVINGSTLVSSSCLIVNSGQTCPSIPAVGQVASLDATVNANGSSTLLTYDALTPTSVDLIEGIVTTLNTSTTQFQIVTNDYLAANSGSVISGKVNLGDPVNVTLSNVLPFVVDSKGLPVEATAFTNGSTQASDILPGQTVMLRVKSFTARSSSTTAASATVDAVALRFTRVAGNVSAQPSPFFSMQSLPLFFGLTTPVQVQFGTGTPSTYLDGYSSTSSISQGDNVSIRALYFGTGVSPSFTAAKVRKN